MAILTRAETVAERLREMILSGELAPGDPLRQGEIAERFGVSTTPVREALAVLVRDGYARQDAHRTVSVFQPSASELADIYEIRGKLEPMLSRYAAKRATEDELQSLEQIVIEMRKVRKGREYLKLNAKFHGLIYQMARKQRAADIVDGLRKTSGSYLNLTVEHDDENYNQQVHAEHEAILEALMNRDAKEAARLTKQHLETTATHVINLV